MSIDSDKCEKLDPVDADRIERFLVALAPLSELQRAAAIHTVMKSINPMILAWWRKNKIPPLNDAGFQYMLIDVIHRDFPDAGKQTKSMMLPARSASGAVSAAAADVPDISGEANEGEGKNG